MFGLSTRATVLWLSVSASTAALLTVCGVAAVNDVLAAPLDWRRVQAALLFALAGAIAESFRVYLPTSRPGNSVRFSVSAAVNIAAVLVFPVEWAVPLVGTAAAIGTGGAWFRRLYNVGQFTLSAAAAGGIWHAMRGGAGPADPVALPWTVAALVAYFLVNTTLTNTIVALASGLPVRLTWWRTNRHTWPASLGMLFIGVLIAVLWSMSPWTIAIAAIPLTAVYYSLRNTVSLETNTVNALFQLADILDARDAYTHGHSLRVGQYAEKLALKMGLSGDDAHMVFLAGRLHDIGKCAIRNEVLLKPGALDDDERAHMCIHPEVGGSMLASFSLFRECARYVRGHHERWDGDGYPDRLSGEDIPLGARVIAVADAFDAMTTTRPYRKALPIAEAYRRLSEGAGSQWDPQAISAFLELLDALDQPPRPRPARRLSRSQLREPMTSILT
jgi:hypothetical protein